MCRLWALVVIVAGFCGACQRLDTSEAPSPPPSREPISVVLVSFDGLRRDRVFGADKSVATPTISAIVESGTSFDNIVPSGCSTKASLTSLYTSLDFPSHRLIDHKAVLPARYTTLAEVLRKEGYETGGFVATPMVAKSLNYDQGFDSYRDFRDDDKYVHSAQIARAATAFIQNADKRKPVFLYLHFEEPHPPWFPAHDGDQESKGVQPFGEGCMHVPEHSTLDTACRSNTCGYWRSLYDQALANADGSLGEILRSMTDAGRGSVLVGITTDHGYDLGERIGFTHGMSPFQEVTRIFFTLGSSSERVRKRLGTRNGAVSSKLARIVDIAPTLLDVLGIPSPNAFEGVSLMNAQAAQFAYVTGYGNRSVRTTRFKLVRFFKHGGTWPIPRDYPTEMMFDLVADPEEKVNVLPLHRTVYEELKQRLDLYEQTSSAPPQSGSDANQLDDAQLERLRALGYIE